MRATSNVMVCFSSKFLFFMTPAADIRSQADIVSRFIRPFSDVCPSSLLEEVAIDFDAQVHGLNWICLSLGGVPAMTSATIAGNTSTPESTIDRKSTSPKVASSLPAPFRAWQSVHNSRYTGDVKNPKGGVRGSDSIKTELLAVCCML